MAGLMIKCPECRKPMTLRTSADITNSCRKAWAYCLDCEIKAIVLAEVQKIEPMFAHLPENATA